jgi:hypothetical protein
MSKQRVCRNCDKPIPATKSYRAKYCSEECRKKFQRAFAAQQMKKNAEAKAAMSKGGASKGIPEYVQRARELVTREFDAAGKLDDEVRELMRDEIRDSIREHIVQRVEGAMETMTGMLPLAMTRLMQDLDSESWPERSRAYALLFRYAMPMMDLDGKKDKDEQQITLVHHIPVADATWFGQRFTEEYLDEGSAPSRPISLDAPYDADNPEPWEAEWPVCYTCKNRVHPDNVTAHAGDRPICTACQYRTSMKRTAKTLPEDTEVFNDDRAISVTTKLRPDAED